MPKARSQPLAALFAINKPTGVPSMTVRTTLAQTCAISTGALTTCPRIRPSSGRQLLNNLQPLFSSSKLFQDPNKATELDQGANKKGGKWGRRGKGRGRDDKVKMGQGGTLDPLADGVLGQSYTCARESCPRPRD